MPRPSPIGIDLERLSAVRDPSLFSHAAFAEDELALLETIGWAQTDSIAIAWSAKEAAAKALGFPLIGNEAALIITDVDVEQETISLAHADGTISAHFALDGDYVCVVAA